MTAPKLPPLPATFGVLAMQPDFVRAVEAYARAAQKIALGAAARDIDYESTFSDWDVYANCLAVVRRLIKEIGEQPQPVPHT